MGQGDLDLSDLRVAIDAVDDELLGLLNRRAQLAAEVATRKQTKGSAFYVPARERAIIDRLQGDNAGPFPGAAIRPVFQEIISACLSLESTVKVSYLGPEATFTHQAVKRHFGTSARALPCGTIAGVFAEVSRGQVDFGVVPVENSTEGVVNHTLDSFVDPALSSDLHITAEIVVDVDHCLMARPGVALADALRVYSHPQALAQCRGWLHENMAKAHLVESPSTADAARTAKEDPGAAAIAAALAAKMYGLEVLREKLQDVADNVTRFLVVGKGDIAPPADGALYKTTVVLVLPDKPGFLYQVLKPFSEHGINLTKIESRPTRQKRWDYLFFLDLDGHVGHPDVGAVIAELDDICELARVLGSYRKADTT